jgi:hypothetical protein
VRIIKKLIDSVGIQAKNTVGELIVNHQTNYRGQVITVTSAVDICAA